MSLVAQYVAAFTRGDSKGLRSLFTADALVQGVLASASLDLALGVWWVMTRIFVEALVPNAWPKCPYNLAVASI